MDRYSLTRDDFIEHLGEQMEFLHGSAVAFDGGFEGEAKRLAMVLRVLLHDTKQSASLLGQLGVKDSLRYLDTAEGIYPANFLPTMGLVMLKATSGQGADYVAPLDDVPPPRIHPTRPFAQWWTAPVTKDKHGSLFSRKDYVLRLANKEGGGHVDHELDSKYAALTRKNGLGWAYSENDGDGRPIETNPALPSVRQIAYEVEVTVSGQLAYLLDPSIDLKTMKELPAALTAGVGRNDPCPCKSGTKYKRCHGQ